MTSEVPKAAVDLSRQAGARAARASSPQEARDILAQAERLARAYSAEPLPEAGRDGHPIEQREVRTEHYMDGKREAQMSPQNVNHDRIAYLFAHDIIDQRQHAAGQRLARDWELSQICPAASSVLVGAGGGGDMHPTERKERAMKEHGEAVRALGYNWPIVALVVERNYTVEVASRMLNVDRKRGMGWLWSALHVLADHYRLPSKPQHDVLAKILASTS